MERRVLIEGICRKIGFSRTDIVEQNCFETVFKCWSNEAPHILIAPESMGEDDRVFAVSTHRNVMALRKGQSGSRKMGCGWNFTTI
jgi:hypothetical protein